jgi:hypothetical protein
VKKFIHDQKTEIMLIARRGRQQDAMWSLHVTARGAVLTGDLAQGLLQTAQADCDG